MTYFRNITLGDRKSQQTLCLDKCFYRYLDIHISTEMDKWHVMTGLKILEISNHRTYAGALIKMVKHL